MARNLLIVESPTKVKTIKKFLGKDFEVMATMGHIVDLPEDRMGIDLENDFTPQYTVVKGKQRVIQQLKQAANEAKTIYLGPDPDREGEAIAWHVANKIVNNSHQCYRIRFNEITPKAIQEALEDPSDINMNLVNAQQARRLLDRLVGYKISPFLWKTVFKGLSAGRVQSVALRIICERETEIRAFIEVEYWTIDVAFEEQKIKFKAELEKFQNKKIEIPNQEQAERILGELKNEKFSVSDISSRLQYRQPAPPFITSTLQQDASRRLGMSPKKTMMIAQQLYEGVTLDDGNQVGLITYMRTDSTRINTEFQDLSKSFIARKYGAGYNGKSINRAKKSDTKIQDAHEAVRPTYLDFEPERIRHSLTSDQYRLYLLIWNRYLASQMAAAQFEITRIDIQAGSYQLKTVGSIQKFDGFLKVYQDLNETDKKDDANKPLPVLQKNQTLNPLEFLPEQHFTKPPPRYNEASLIKELEQKGIGRPSTYAQIISTLLERKYVELKEKRFFPTEVGEVVNQILVTCFPDIIDTGFTSQMENRLDTIEQGQSDWIEILKNFYVPFEIKLTELESQRQTIKAGLRDTTDIPCPKCGGELLIKWGKHGKFMACSNFPTCRYTQPLPEQVEAMSTETKCPKCEQGNLILRTGKYGRFVACSRYPDCDYTGPYSIGIKCPEPDCGGDLVEKQTKKKKIYYSCSNYPKCKFSTWDKPVAIPCPQCHAPFLLEKQSQRSAGQQYCLKCKYKGKAHSGDHPE